MGIGVGIFLIVIGAVLRFGITTDVAGLDLDAIGIILILAGVAVVVLTMLMMVLRRDRPRQAGMRSDSDVI